MKENIRVIQGKIYQAISIAEKGGFVMGFRYVVNLLMECAEELQHPLW